MFGNVRSKWMLPGLATLVVAITLPSLILARGLAGGSPATQVRMGSGDVLPSQTVELTLEAVDVPAEGLGTYRVDVTVADPGVAKVVDCVGDPNGLFPGLPPVPECTILAPDQVRAGSIRFTAGATGTFPLADITFEGKGEPGECSDLTVEILEFLDWEDQPISVTAQNGEICISQCDDADGDGVCDLDDDCPNTPNGQEVDVNGCAQAQVDQDKDSKCDPGKSSPLWCTGSDNCPTVANPGQENHDDDPQADCVDPDDDNDGVTDAAEQACDSDPLDANSKCEVCDGADNDKDGQTDEGFPNHDGDSQADCVDPDDDNDGVLDGEDNCPFVANSGQSDIDDDGDGDVCDDDIDGDEVSNDDEEFYGSDPENANSTPESLGWDQAHGDDSCSNGVDDDGDATMDAGESDGPDPGSEADCEVAVTPTPKPTGTPTPTVTPIAGPSIAMVAGWNDKCYAGDEKSVENALAGIADKVLAIYMLNSSQAFDRWFPGRSDVSNITTLKPYDQLFVLMSGNASWVQEQTAQTQTSVSLIQGWNSVCYMGQTKPVGDATAGIVDAIAILYRLLDTQVWARYVPNRPDVSDISTLAQTDSVLILVTQQGGIQWVFDP